LIVGLEKIPVIVKQFSDLQRLEVSLIENIQRENLNPIEEAKAYVYLLEQSHIRQEELATLLRTLLDCYNFQEKCKIHY